MIGALLFVAGLAATDPDRASATAWPDPEITARIAVSPKLFRDYDGVASQVFVAHHRRARPLQQGFSIPPKLCGTGTTTMGTSRAPTPEPSPQTRQTISLACQSAIWQSDRLSR